MKTSPSDHRSSCSPAETQNSGQELCSGSSNNEESACEELQRPVDCGGLRAGSAIELIVIGLLAALIILLAVPVVSELSPNSTHTEFSPIISKPTR